MKTLILVFIALTMLQGCATTSQKEIAYTSDIAELRARLERSERDKEFLTVELIKEKEKTAVQRRMIKMQLEEQH